MAQLRHRRAFSSSAKAPAIWRMAFLKGSSVAVRSSPAAVSTRTPGLIERQDAKLLGDELAGKPLGILDQHRADAVALDAIEECEKAWPRLDGVRAADGRIIVGIDNPQSPRASHKSRWRRAAACRCPCRRQHWPPSSCAGRQSPAGRDPGRPSHGPGLDGAQRRRRALAHQAAHRGAWRCRGC